VVTCAYPPQPQPRVSHWCHTFRLDSIGANDFLGSQNSASDQASLLAFLSRESPSDRHVRDSVLPELPARRHEELGLARRRYVDLVPAPRTVPRKEERLEQLTAHLRGRGLFARADLLSRDACPLCRHPPRHAAGVCSCRRRDHFFRREEAREAGGRTKAQHDEHATALMPSCTASSQLASCLLRGRLTFVSRALTRPTVKRRAR